jgi:hypothetical protein
MAVNGSQYRCRMTVSPWARRGAAAVGAARAQALDGDGAFVSSLHSAAALYHRAPHTTAIRFSFATEILRLRQGPRGRPRGTCPRPSRPAARRRSRPARSASRTSPRTSARSPSPPPMDDGWWMMDDGRWTMDFFPSLPSSPSWSWEVDCVRSCTLRKSRCPPSCHPSMLGSQFLSPLRVAPPRSPPPPPVPRNVRAGYYTLSLSSILYHYYCMKVV